MDKRMDVINFKDRRAMHGGKVAPSVRIIWLRVLEMLFGKNNSFLNESDYG